MEGRSRLDCVLLQLMDNEQRVHDLKVQLTTVQGNHKESMDQLGEKSRLVASLKTEVAKLQQQNQSMTEEVHLLITLYSWDIDTLRVCSRSRISY